MYYKLIDKKTIKCNREDVEEIFDSNRILKQTRIENGLFVSTVFLVIDHSYALEDNPILFETLIFDHNKSRRFDEIFCERYETYEKAIKGHEVAIKYAEKQIP